MATKLYCSVSGKTKQVTKLYCSVNITQSISLTTFLSGSDPAAFTAAAREYTYNAFSDKTLYRTPYMVARKNGQYVQFLFGTSYTTLSSNYMQFTSFTQLQLFLEGVYYGDPGFTYTSGKTAYALASFLFDIPNGQYVNLLRFGVGSVSRKVTKLYGSANGKTVLVYQG